MPRIKIYGLKVWKILKRTFTNSSVASVLLSITTGILIGFLVMLFVGGFSNALKGLGAIFTGAFATPATFGNMLFSAGPLILIGLAVGFSFKSGLFNIGASGQFMIGGVAALYAAHLLNLPPVIHFIVATLFAIIAGALWAGLPGILKAYFNVNEVIATIMMNYIAAHLTFMLAKNALVYDSGITGISQVFPTATVPRLGIQYLFSGSYIDMGILISIVIAFLIYVVLNKTKLGYELQAVGHSTDASHYAGINVKFNIIKAMLISGGLAGFAAALYYLPENPGKFTALAQVNAYGFTGISVALIAQNNPLGTIFSGMFISYIQKGANLLQFYGFDKEITNIITSVIIYMIAISSFISFYFTQKRLKRKALEHVAEQEEK